MKIEHIVTEGEVVAFPKKHRGDISNMHSCPKCGGDTHGGKYQGHEVQVCIPCKQVYLPPNSGIDQQGNKISEDQLNEYLVRAGMPVEDVLTLNLFQDFDPEEGCAARSPEFAQEPLWKQVVRKYAPIAAALEKQILALNRPLTHSQAEEIDNVWYDGSDAYDDMEIEYLVDIYNRQIATVEAVIAGELQDDDEEFGEGVAEGFFGNKVYYVSSENGETEAGSKEEAQALVAKLKKAGILASVKVRKVKEGVAEGSRTPQDWEVKSAVWGLDKRGVYQEPQNIKSHFVRADRSSRAEEKAKREYEPGRQTWTIHPRGSKQQGVAEAAKGILHRVRYQYDDPSGAGIASGHITLHAPDKAAAARYAASDLSKKGKKNVKVLAVTPQKQDVAEGSSLGGYKGRVDTEVRSREEYLAVMKELQRAAKQTGQHIECDVVWEKMRVFSNTMNSDELDAFIDNTLDQGLAEGLNFNDKKGKWEWDDGTYVDPDELTPAQKQRVQQWKTANPGKRPSRASVPDTREPARGFGGRVFEAEQERNRNALWAQITSYEKRAKATKNDIKKQHLLKMADELRGKLAPTNEERLAESLTQLATLIKESK